jgi:hypothetical protein
MEWAYVRHPVTGLTARVARPALAHHLRCGWIETEPPEPEPAEAAAGTPAADDSSTQKKPRRRAANTETGE